MKKRNVSMTLISILLLPSLLWAGGTFEGNGGDGYYENGQLYSLDLWESGLHLNPFLEQGPASEDVVNIIRQKLSNISGLPVDMLANKLSAIRRRTPYYGQMLVMGIRRFSWIYSQPNLMPIDDEESPLDLDRSKLAQVAARAGFNVFINSRYWEQLNDANKVALVIHELNYIVVPAERVGREKEGRFKQSSLLTRQLTANLFRAVWDPALNMEIWGENSLMAETKADDSSELRFRYLSGADNVAYFYILKGRVGVNARLLPDYYEFVGGSRPPAQFSTEVSSQAVGGVTNQICQGLAKGLAWNTATFWKMDPYRHRKNIVPEYKIEVNLVARGSLYKADFESYSRTGEDRHYALVLRVVESTWGAQEDTGLESEYKFRRKSFSYEVNDQSDLSPEEPREQNTPFSLSGCKKKLESGLRDLLNRPLR